MSKSTKNNELSQVTTNPFKAFFDTDNVLKQHEKTVNIKGKDGVESEVVKYEMTVNTINNKDVPSVVITDRQAIESIQGLYNISNMDKYLQYRRGAYLVQLMNSDFVKVNGYKSVSKVAETIDIGLQGSSVNALESVARRLEVDFDNNGNVILPDGLPVLPFWTYNNIISLVVETDYGYDRSHLIDFLEKTNVNALTSQQKVKELFKEYKAGKFDGSLELPDKIAESEKKANDNKEKAKAEKERQKELRDNANKYIADKMSNRKTVSEKKAFILELLESFENSVNELSSDLHNELSANFENIMKLVIQYEVSEQSE